MACDYAALFVREVRSGKSLDDAFKTYCNAQLVRPTTRDLWEECKGDPERCHIEWYAASSCLARAEEAITKGANDEELAAAFKSGLRDDFDRELLFFALPKNRRPDAAYLLKRLSDADLETATKLLGVRYVANEIVRRG